MQDALACLIDWISLPSSQALFISFMKISIFQRCLYNQLIGDFPPLNRNTYMKWYALYSLDIKKKNK